MTNVVANEHAWVNYCTKQTGLNYRSDVRPYVLR